MNTYVEKKFNESDIDCACLNVC